MPVDNNNNNDDHNDDDESDWSLDDELDDNHYTSNDNYGHDHDDDCPLLNLWVPARLTIDPTASGTAEWLLIPQLPTLSKAEFPFQILMQYIL